MKSTLTFYGRSITRSHFLIFCPNNVRMSQQAIKSFSGFHYILSHQPSPKNFFVKSFSRYFGQFWWSWSILVKIRDIIFLVMWLVVVTMKQLLNIDFRTSHFNHFINSREHGLHLASTQTSSLRQCLARRRNFEVTKLIFFIDLTNILIWMLENVSNESYY